jgi:inhibitor of KinA sporulation pathway (predicted exonuclease)
MKYLVIDFEATCQKKGKWPLQEIIEFPCIIIDSVSGETIDIFHQYVRPIKNPILSDFCTELTGIKQETVDKANEFTEVFKDFVQWLQLNELQLDEVIPICCGEWDFKICFPKQASISGMKVPGFLKRWINIKKVVAKYTNTSVGGMSEMLRVCELEKLGRHHSGIDDTKNIARCVQKIVIDYGEIPESFYSYAQ